MRCKIEFELDGVMVSRVCRINEDADVTEFSFTESPGTNVVIKIFDQQITVKKSGLMNLEANHVVGEESEIKYSINMNGKNFYGETFVKTTNVSYEDNVISITFIREDEVIIQRWEIK